MSLKKTIELRVSLGILFILMFLQVNKAGKLIATKSVGTDHLQSPQYLGTVDGKEFYHIATVVADWAAASELCQASNMGLASLETKAETELVVIAIREVGQSWMWTTGRLIRNHEAFQWSNSGSRLIADSVTSWEDRAVAEYCVSFSIGASAATFIGLPCSRHGLYVLCQQQV